MSFNNWLKGQVFVVCLVIITLLVGTGIGYNPSTVLADEPAVIAIAARGTHSLALKNDGSVWAWGNNSYGQLGDGSTTNRSYPVQVRDGTGVGFLEGIVAIAAGGGHSLALKNDGTVWAWGDNNGRQLGNDSRQENHLPIQVISPDGSTYLGDIHDIIAGPSQSFARDDSGQAWAWGYNYYGQLGGGTNNYNCTRPVLVQGLSGISQISSGNEHTLALKDDGTVWAWGQGSQGTGTNSSRLPLQVMGPEGEGYLTGIKMVGAGDWSSAALSVAGAVYQWGSYPRIVEGLDEISAIAMTDYSNITALKRDGSVWQKQYSTYAMVVGLSDVVAISGGYSHCLALDDQGKVWAWGSNNYGQLGNGSAEYSSVPVEVNFGKPYDNVAPEVVSTNPVANASEVPLNSAITINFNEPIKSGSNFSALRLLDKDGNTISLGKKSIVDNTLILEPLNDLIFAMEYTVIIPTDAVLDLSNNELNSEFCFSFVAGSTISVTGVNLDRAQFILPVDGPSVALQATITPLNASNKNLSWSSSNPEVATVDTNGLITPLSIGLTVITVTTEDGGFSAQCSVSVAEWVRVTGVSLEQNTLNLGLGQTGTLKAIITPTDASNQKLYWASDHSNIAQVDSEGQVTAQSPGEAIITVTTEDGSYTANCTCTVSDMVVDFPDPNLRARIRQEIGKATGDIWQSDLLKLNSFSATYTGITNLEGLQYLSNITSLDLYGNQIDDISLLSNLVYLRSLRVGSNGIKKLGPLEQLTELQEINLSNNQVRDIKPLSNLLQLKRIYLNYNQIRDITPLVTNSNNGGLRSTGDDPWERGFVDLRGNYLDINEDSATASDIQTLLDRGVDVQFTPQFQAPPDEKPQDINVASVVIDNHPDARPQTGLNDAEVVFETTVALGITRLLAVYDPGQTFAEIGPVRSARRNLVELAAGYSGAMLHCGGSTNALHFLNHMPLMDFDEIYGSGNYFFRSSARQAPHNLYTNKDLILQGIEEKNGEPTNFNKALPTGEMSGGTPAAQVTVRFQGQSYDTVFKWDSSSNEYQRYEKELPCLLAEGSPIKTTNVLVLSTPHEKYFDPVAGEWVVQAKVTGEGPASFYRDGKVWNGRWKKDSSSTGFIFTVDGQTMHFSSGTSWILFDELPAIISTDPLDGQHSVDVSRNLYVYLNNELITGPEFGLIKMYDEKGNPIATEQELLEKSLIIHPTAPLAYNCYYTLRIPAAALVDARGKSLDQETVITFRTRDKYDFNLTLGQGWNLVSVSRPLQSFELVQEDVEAWLAYALKDGKLGWVTDPDEIREELNNPASAVFIKTVRPTVMRFDWAETDDPRNTFAAKELSAGWNLVGSSSRTYLKNNLASLRFSNGQGLTQAYNPSSFNTCKTDNNRAVWSSQLLDISEWQVNEIMSPWDGYWVYLRGTNQLYSIPVYYRQGGVVVPKPKQPPHGTSGTGGSISDEEIH